MRLSPETIELLKNFATINNSIVIPPGNVIRTINSERNVLAKAFVSETFPRDIPIYELRQFLNIFTLHKDADVDFSDEHYILVSQGQTKMKFYYADLFSLEKNLNIPKQDIEFADIVYSVSLDSEILERVRKAANMYLLTDLSLVGSDGEVQLTAHNKEDTTSRSYSINLGSTNIDFNFNFVEKNIMILPGAYQLDIGCFAGNRIISKFTHQNLSLEYIISLEPDSSFVRNE
jgi:hypothetical protein